MDSPCLFHRGHCPALSELQCLQTLVSNSTPDFCEVNTPLLLPLGSLWIVGNTSSVLELFILARISSGC